MGQFDFLLIIARGRTNTGPLGRVSEGTLLICHREERSDVAIHLKFLLDCRARQPGLAMTKHADPLTFLFYSRHPV